ncbi:hypothetical protein HOD30_02825 [Candidatus Peregrinibacteria bacterium]|jgi:hypothetical protein|nr:hypothetical protein [Candidatus Peregrinibacteria bacterium]MBT4631521.1 hypothetical protein [Candidatus Peregrinibacteria bacterium]MBT5516984.1 hypothetical protein [Candidatus Peregrinibacteria bacterium]MBT5824259.1 hypothetical protein [Candidatus Peregrinibacteria bacterium]
MKFPEGPVAIYTNNNDARKIAGLFLRGAVNESQAPRTVIACDDAGKIAANYRKWLIELLEAAGVQHLTINRKLGCRWQNVAEDSGLVVKPVFALSDPDKLSSGVDVPEHPHLASEKYYLSTNKPGGKHAHVGFAPRFDRPVTDWAKIDTQWANVDLKGRITGFAGRLNAYSTGMDANNFLHGHGLVHGDVKPAQLTEFPNADDDGYTTKLADFDILRPASSEDTKPGNLTKDYFDGRYPHTENDLFKRVPLSTGRDVFAWGVSLFEAHLGYPNYARIAFIDGWLRGTLPINFKHSMSSALESVVRNMLARRSEDRPDLDEVLQVYGPYAAEVYDAAVRRYS